jgi:hypothetical protein
VNRRDAFRTAIAAAVSAMMPRSASIVDDIATTFGVPATSIPDRPILYGHVDFFEFDTARLLRCHEEMAMRLAVAYAEKIDRDWGCL